MHSSAWKVHKIGRKWESQTCRKAGKLMSKVLEQKTWRSAAAMEGQGIAENVLKHRDKNASSWHQLNVSRAQSQCLRFIDFHFVIGAICSITNRVANVFDFRSSLQSGLHWNAMRVINAEQHYSRQQEQWKGDEEVKARMVRVEQGCICSVVQYNLHCHPIGTRTCNSCQRQ